MSELATRIQNLMKERERMQDEKRSLELEINFKNERLVEAKESLSEKGVDYDTPEDLAQEISDKKERLEEVVTNMERALNSADTIDNPVDKPVVVVPDDMFAELDI